MTPLELLYYLGYSVHRGYGTKTQKRLPARVISIGNITLGGTGKTPAAIALTYEAKQRGFAPCILTRGYGGKAKGPCFVSRGEGPLLNAYDAGDEAFLMAEKLKGIPVVKGPDRYEAGMFALRNLRVQTAHSQSEWIFILDDGFQHWGLFRDMDILLLDGMNPFGNRSCRRRISESWSVRYRLISS
jgi:tetraacyldisaccharide 4'-kinase